MTRDPERFRRLLEEERVLVVGAIENLKHESPGSMEDEGEELPVDENMADVATATIDREIGYSLRESEERRLEAIDAALGRIDDGSYGRCEVCATAIEEERLEAIPWTSLCLDDARKAERG